MARQTFVVVVDTGSAPPMETHVLRDCLEEGMSDLDGADFYSPEVVSVINTQTDKSP